SPTVFEPEFPCPFRAGAVGYIGYESGQFLEPLPCVMRPGPGMPDIAFGMYLWLLATCRDTGRSWISVMGRGSTPTGARADAERRGVEVPGRIAKSSQPTKRTVETQRARPPHRRQSSPVLARSDAEQVVQATLSASEYRACVSEAKEHISRGDAYEIC